MSRLACITLECTTLAAVYLLDRCTPPPDTPVILYVDNIVNDMNVVLFTVPNTPPILLTSIMPDPDQRTVSEVYIIQTAIIFFRTGDSLSLRRPHLFLSVPNRSDFHPAIGDHFHPRLPLQHVNTLSIQNGCLTIFHGRGRNRWLELLKLMPRVQILYIESWRPPYSLSVPPTDDCDIIFILNARTWLPGGNLAVLLPQLKRISLKYVRFYKEGDADNSVIRALAEALKLRKDAGRGIRELKIQGEEEVRGDSLDLLTPHVGQLTWVRIKRESS